ncbi:Post-GPI attachment to proteins factor 3, partial [Conglomerata obtusa]
MNIFIIGYMILYDFNYLLHKITCSVFLILTFSCWILQYTAFEKKSYSKYIIAYIIVVLIGAGIEIMDIPPIWFLIDSHAIWHLITALAAPLYYEFLKNDMLHKHCT